jgi:hypothetical protein
MNVDWPGSWKAGTRKVVYYCTTPLLNSRVTLLFNGTGVGTAVLSCTDPAIQSFQNIFLLKEQQFNICLF